MRRRLIWTIVPIILLACTAAAGAQNQSESQPPEPEEYGREEFSPFLKALRRGEIVLFGSFPLSLFLCFETYDVYRFFYHDRDIRYAPWPFRRPDAVSYEDKENIGVLLSAISVSLVFAIADYAIGRALERRAARRSSSDS